MFPYSSPPEWKCYDCKKCKTNNGVKQNHANRWAGLLADEKNVAVPHVVEIPEEWTTVVALDDGDKWLINRGKSRCATRPRDARHHRRCSEHEREEQSRERRRE